MRPLPLKQACKLLPLLLLLGCCLNAAAQKFSWQAAVSPAAASGYHSILLSPEVAGLSQEDFADLRLYDASGQEVPYLLRNEQQVQYKKLFRPYNIVSYTHRSGCCSELIIANPDQKKIDNISLIIRNADVKKEVALSGSDNQQDWYVLKAHDVLYAARNTESTTEVKLLNFPLSDYSFFRVRLDDSASAPLNILSAGYYDTSTESGKYTEVPLQSFARTDSAATKRTYLRLQFPQPVYPDRLAFDITAPVLYHRQARLLTPDTASEPPERRGFLRKRRKGAFTPEDFRASIPFLLHSNEPAIVELPRKQVEELLLEIDNADNPPLTIAAVKAYQLNRYLVADLKAGEAYELRFGNEKAKAPAYELSYFRDKIPADVPVLEVGKVTDLSDSDGGGARVATSKIFIWVAIALVVAALAFMSVRLLNEMNR